MEITLNNKLDRLEAGRIIRNIASQTCLHTFQQLINKDKKVSEVQFHNRWMKLLDKEFDQGFVGCWYDPPPGGVAVIFGDDIKYERINYSNLRYKEYWAKMKTYFIDDGLGYVFASPYTLVDNVPIIGDFGFTYYLGKSVKIKDHFRRCNELLNHLLERIEIGMIFANIFADSNNIIKDHHLENFVVGITDKTGSDLGHTIPFVDRNPTPEENAMINSGEAEKINKAINTARLFINNNERYEVSDNCAFTFEPRFISPGEKLPMFSFHTIVQFIEGKKQILTNFDGLLNFLGMDWIKQ